MINQELIKLHEILLKDISNLDDAEKISIIQDRITQALNLDKRRWNEKMLSNVSIRTKKATRPKMQEGDVYEIYLEEVKVYGYVAILKLEDDKEEDDFSVFGLFNYFSKLPEKLEKIIAKLTRENIFMFADSGHTGIIRKEWKKVTNLTFDWQVDFSKLEYLKVDNGGVLRPNERYYFKSVGHPNNGNYMRIDYKEAVNINNPYGLNGQDWIEGYLVGAFRGKKLIEMEEEGWSQVKYD
ncbi:hypothetical protein [Listeria monocytogenes]|uniref:hypothetical protein n=1 Tax=Listeria monocytogenes TaxID=1639 RepID=UPI0008544CD4|nr:hypothetical protein [Listeria monocytogenes]EAD7603058.1 hypothetical protein [Listeria monocytogenes]OEP26606.1 hypothetical protein AF973_06355 [Listeria monocytogenes]OEP30675.1 hypothetical protein AJM35_09000 [Listeria monocytogenes]HAA0616133.1 hypothetical protein [Listeria monocytogenes]